MRCLGFVAIFLLSTGCVTRREDQFGKAVEGPDRALAISRTNDLLDLLSSGQCGRIYDESARLFRAESRPNWLGECQEILEHAGRWAEFTTESVETCGKKVVCVIGTARAGSGARKILAAWIWENDDPRLDYFSIDEAGTFPPIPRRLADPIPPRSPLAG